MFNAFRRIKDYLAARQYRKGYETAKRVIDESGIETAVVVFSDYTVVSEDNFDKGFLAAIKDAVINKVKE